MDPKQSTLADIIASESGSFTSSSSASSKEGNDRKLFDANNEEESVGLHITGDYDLEDDDDLDINKKCRKYGCGNDEELEETYFFEPPNFEHIKNYEQYLDHFVTDKDLYFFESEDVARTITTLGYRVPELLNREQFDEVIESIRAKRLEKRRDDIHISYKIPEAEITCPLMQALAKRELVNRNGHSACIIFLRTTNAKGQEVSGWIDYGVRLKKEEDQWYDYFIGKKKLIPRPSDLCFYNWATFQVRFNSSELFLVTTHIVDGLQFENKWDRKLVTVDPSRPPGDNTLVTRIESPNYDDCALYDHTVQAKA